VTDLLQRYPDLVILAIDQMSLYFQATLTHVWAPKGQTPMVRIAPQRDHIHWYGALDVRRGRDIAVPALEQTNEVTADFLRMLLMLFPTQPILLLLDRALCRAVPGGRPADHYAGRPGGGLPGGRSIRPARPAAQRHATTGPNVLPARRHALRIQPARRRMARWPASSPICRPPVV
jgi:hypothetical protein